MLHSAQNEDAKKLDWRLKEFVFDWIKLFVSLLVGLYGAWLFTYVWFWFVCPVFGVPALTVAQAYGLQLVFLFKG
ncbi:hypothetical protein [Gloeobacter morelensis]|uniref:hypothetical protein n=1 Tax=Gloeobacter morelensis TaxID=2907343 RepID=UPI001E4F5901|nr:hypothetical protein [Gloeobacter morelensis]UFP97193.1 hypothetical protein ISF26_24030 [Gloeobacter morelensis MG652769]